MTDNRFYVYVLLDPRKPGKYTYGDVCFDYKPFYVGKGCNNRHKDHIKEARNSTKNSYKLNIIRSILKLNLLPIAVKLKEKMTNIEANNLEIYYISLIGRYDLNKGPLTNKTDGGDGTINVSPDVIERQKITFQKTISKNPGIIINQVVKHKKTLEEHPEILIELGKKISDNYKNKPEIKLKISSSLKKTYEENPNILINMGNTQKQRYKEDPNIMKNAVEKRINTYKNNPEIAKNAKIKREETHKNNPEIRINANQKRNETHKNNPQIMIEVGKKLTILHKENPHFFDERSKNYSNDCKLRSVLKEECFNYIKEHNINKNILDIPSGHKPSKVWENFKKFLLENFK